MSAHIRHDHEEQLESLIHGKLPRNLTWSAVTDLIAQIGEVQPHGHDEFFFVVGQKKELFKRPSGHDLDVEEISRLRHFFHDAGALKAGVAAAPAKARQSGCMVVAIDHHAAHVYHDRGVNLPEDEVAVKPYDPHGFHHHLIHRKEAHYVGERVPEEDSWYEEIAQDLAHAEEIVLMGHSTGTSNAAAFLGDYLKSHHPETFQRIIADETVDLSALTEGEIEVIAKNAFARQG
ncbi:MAG: hypothetical protein P4K93_10685 [Terracidiphilus sp.]|nr:hypothetical protein [Terracidiphilus sp.]MDR3798612.1 hypothetical protein [Terracidiphilus sp.]